MNGDRLSQLFAWYQQDNEGEAIIASVYKGNDLPQAIEQIQCWVCKCPDAIITRESFLRWLQRVAEQYATRNGSSVYFDAATYAASLLGAEATVRFPELYRLAKSGLSLEQIQQQIRHWSGTPALPPNPDAIAVGGKYGKSTRTRHVRGLMWKLECPHGHAYEQSTNEFVAIEPRCPTCELSKASDDARLDEAQEKVRDWYKNHDGLVWMKIHASLKSHQVGSFQYEQLAKELHALIWVRISAKADHYQDQGYKVTAWLGTIADNALKDYFKQEYRRNELASMTPLLNDDGSVRTEVDLFTPQLTHSTEAGVTQARGPMGVAPD